MPELNNEKIRNGVRKSYAEIANANSGCCSPAPTTGACCGTDAGLESPSTASPEAISIKIGYSEDAVGAVPEGANMGLGCGNPQAIAALKHGETVLDLGSGGGFDCFLAAREVGRDGHVIGVDMTSEMIGKARQNAIKAGFDNVEFRLGEIENLPVADNTVDVIISNCVINLSPEKIKVFKEAFRVLKPRGRLAIADIVAIDRLPDALQNDFALYTGCMAGASLIDDLRAMLEEAGFTDIQIKPKDDSKEIIRDWVPDMKIEDFLVSAMIAAVK